MERFVAQDLKGRRVGILGSEDVLWRGIAIECKERKRLPAFLTRCMAQAESHAEGGTAMVGLHELGQGHERDLVVLRYGEFKKMMGER